MSRCRQADGKAFVAEIGAESQNVDARAAVDRVGILGRLLTEPVAALCAVFDVVAATAADSVAAVAAFNRIVDRSR